MSLVEGALQETRQRPPEEALFWFWYHPATDELKHIDQGTHTTFAYYELGFTRPLRPDEEEDGIDLADNEIIDMALKAGWVRGRYGKRYKNPYGSMSWDAMWDDETHGQPMELSLQGKNRNDVWKTAAMVAGRWPYVTLFVDFGATHDMESVKLEGDDLERYLKRGVIAKRRLGESVLFKGAMDFGHYSTDTTVLENPSRDEFAALMRSSAHGELRGLLTEQNLFVWDATDATHSEMSVWLSRNLGVFANGSDIEFYADHIVMNSFYPCDQHGNAIDLDDDRVSVQVAETGEWLRGKLKRYLTPDMEIVLRIDGGSEEFRA